MRSLYERKLTFKTLNQFRGPMGRPRECRYRRYIHKGEKMNKKEIVTMLVFTAALGLSLNARTEETKTEKLEAQSNKTVDAIKEEYRDVKDKTCKMVYGKLKCVQKKIKHKAQTASDKIKTEAKELKNKID